jgi:hypothetical protein
MKLSFFTQIMTVLVVAGSMTCHYQPSERRIEELETFTIGSDSLGRIKGTPIQVQTEPYYQNPQILNQDSLAFILLKNAILEEDLQVDSSNYYFRIFKNPTTSSLFAIIVMFEPDATFFFTKKKDKWQKVNKLTTPDFMRVSPIWSEFGDYNFDGYQDIALHRTTSNGWASLYYNVFLFRPKIGDYEFKKDLSNLGCPVILKEAKRIKARHASCGGGCFEIEEYRWNADTLQLAKLLEKRMLSDTLITSYFSETGILTKIEKRGISKEEKDKILNYCSTDKKH